MRMTDCIELLIITFLASKVEGKKKKVTFNTCQSISLQSNIHSKGQSHRTHCSSFADL